MTAWLDHMILVHPWLLSGLLSLVICTGSVLIAAWVWIERIK